MQLHHLRVDFHLLYGDCGNEVITRMCNRDYRTSQVCAALAVHAVAHFTKSHNCEILRRRNIQPFVVTCSIQIVSQSAVVISLTTAQSFWCCSIISKIDFLRHIHPRIMYTSLYLYLQGNVCSWLIHSSDHGVSTDCRTRLRGLNEDRDLKGAVKGSAPGGSRSLTRTWGDENHVISRKVLTARTELSAHSVNDTLTKQKLNPKEDISLCVCVYVCVYTSSTPANS